MTDATDYFRADVEAKVAAEFGSERDAERVADAAVRLRDAEGVEWSPSFVAERMADAPKDRSVPEKWNWLLGVAGGEVEDVTEYELDGGR
ncbi:hypothetical protein [Halorussus caseinilyticus]|uniref:Uncharacterized protein n=1 Tax=Halorussus caseinilyticus TaxID=3034025 RepID=A0ABD5WJM5_9EURY|nr:hypothetical protein [Halorussus sp. DT72]